MVLLELVWLFLLLLIESRGLAHGNTTATATTTTTCFMRPDTVAYCEMFNHHCDSTFCPTCLHAHECDTQCGICSIVNATETTTTSTTSTTSTLLLNSLPVMATFTTTALLVSNITSTDTTWTTSMGLPPVPAHTAQSADATSLLLVLLLIALLLVVVPCVIAACLWLFRKLPHPQLASKVSSSTMQPVMREEFDTTAASQNETPRSYDMNDMMSMPEANVKCVPELFELDVLPLKRMSPREVPMATLDRRAMPHNSAQQLVPHQVQQRSPGFVEPSPCPYLEREGQRRTSSYVQNPSQQRQQPQRLTFEQVEHIQQQQEQTLRQSTLEQLEQTQQQQEQLQQHHPQPLQLTFEQLEQLEKHQEDEQQRQQSLHLKQQQPQVLKLEQLDKLQEHQIQQQQQYHHQPYQYHPHDVEIEQMEKQQGNLPWHQQVRETQFQQQELLEQQQHQQRQQQHLLKQQMQHRQQQHHLQQQQHCQQVDLQRQHDNQQTQQQLHQEVQPVQQHVPLAHAICREPKLPQMQHTPLATILAEIGLPTLHRRRYTLDAGSDESHEQWSQAEPGDGAQSPVLQSIEPIHAMQAGFWQTPLPPIPLLPPSQPVVRQRGSD